MRELAPPHEADHPLVRMVPGGLYTMNLTYKNTNEQMILNLAAQSVGVAGVATVLENFGEKPAFCRSEVADW